MCLGCQFDVNIGPLVQNIHLLIHRPFQLSLEGCTVVLLNNVLRQTIEIQDTKWTGHFFTLVELDC